MDAATSSDPHWDLVIEIATKLWIDGRYVADLYPSPAQRFVDLQWAGREAGRILGGRSELRTTYRRESELRVVTVTVTYVDVDGIGLEKVEKRLEAVMRMVLEEQGARP
ncbi:hypothetical protein [Marmoricola sp. URHA0025 HA25]